MSVCLCLYVCLPLPVWLYGVWPCLQGLLMSIIGQGFDYLFKMVVIGDSGVGKTNLLSRFDKNEFTHESKATIGVEFATKTLPLDTHRVKIQIWDTAGQERYRSITHAYYKGAAGALLVFDLTRRDTYLNLTKWLKELKENSKEHIVCILIGNKSDRVGDRTIPQQESLDFAQAQRLHYLETSAFNGENVDEAFMTVIREMFEYSRKGSQALRKEVVRPGLVITPTIKDNNQNRRKGCCK